MDLARFVKIILLPLLLFSWVGIVWRLGTPQFRKVSRVVSWFVYKCLWALHMQMKMNKTLKYHWWIDVEGIGGNGSVIFPSAQRRGSYSSAVTWLPIPVYMWCLEIQPGCRYKTKGNSLLWYDLSRSPKVNATAVKWNIMYDFISMRNSSWHAYLVEFMRYSPSKICLTFIRTFKFTIIMTAFSISFTACSVKSRRSTFCWKRLVTVSWGK